jgi:hypothetical protein
VFSPNNPDNTAMTITYSNLMAKVGPGAASAIPDLIEVMTHGRGHISYASMQALVTVGHDNESVLQSFMTNLSAENSRVRLNAAIGLGLLGLLTAQIAAAGGCEVLGVDLDANEFLTPAAGDTVESGSSVSTTACCRAALMNFV